MTISRDHHHLTDREIAAFWQQVAPAPTRRSATRLMTLAWCAALSLMACTFVLLLWAIDTVGR